MGDLDQSISSGGEAQIIYPGDKYGQIFTAGATGTLDQVDLYLYKYASTTNDVVVELWSVSNGLPSAKTSDLGTISNGDVTTSYAFRTLSISSGPSVTSGTQYALVYYLSGGTGNYAHRVRALDSGLDSHEVFYNGSAWKLSYGVQAQKAYIDSVVDLNLATMSGGKQISNTYQYATQWTAGDSGELDQAETVVYLYAGSLAAINFDLRVDSSGSPGSVATNGDLGRIANGDLSSSYAWRTVNPATGPTLASGTDYWHTLYKDNTDGSGNIAMYFGWIDNLVYVSSNSGTTWNTQNLYFKTYVDTSGGGATVISGIEEQLILSEAA